MSIPWSLVLFSLIAGAGGVMLACAGLGEFLKMSSKAKSKIIIAALIVIVAGGVCSVFHLQSPGNFMAAIAHLTSFSGISIELLLLGSLIVCGVVFLIGALRGQATLAKVFGILCIILGVALAFMVGDSYMIGARVGWNTIFVPLSYLFSSVALGAFLAMLFLGGEEDKAAKKIVGIIALAGAVLAAIFCVAYGMYAGDIAVPAGASYYVVAAIGGAVAAAAGFFAAFKQNSFAWALVGIVGAIVCGLFIRMFMWSAGANIFDAFDFAIYERALFMPPM